MVAGGQPLRLGPFIGGLNTASDPTAIADAELSICENFELEIDGSLRSRPAFQELEGKSTWTQRIVMLCEGVFGNNHYLIGSNTDGVFHYLNGVWTEITATFQASAAVQYADFIYLVPKPGSADGGKWSPGGGYTAIPAIPEGQACVIHKERLFIVPGVESTADTSRLKFSNAGDFETWDVSDFVDVGQGDGSKLIDITVFQDNLLLFKNNSTYVLSYDTRPSEAVLRKISLTIGVNKQFNMVNYENQVYIFHGGWVYEIINYDFQRLNTKVPFVRDDTAPSAFANEDISVSLLEDRLICRYYAKVYSYSLRTRTWSEWESIADELQYFGPIQTIRPSSGNEYYSGSAITAIRTVIKFFDTYTATTKEETLFPDPSIIDTFTRVTANAWSIADSGQLWTCSGGSASDFSTDGTKGIMSLGSVNVSRFASLPVVVQDGSILLSVSPNVVAATAPIYVDIFARYTGNDYFMLRLHFKTTGNFSLELHKSVGGVFSTVVVGSNIASYAANDTINIRFQFEGSSIRAKAWQSTLLEPLTWNTDQTDATVPAASISLLIRAQLETGNTNTLPVLVRFDNLQIGLMAAVIRIITCSAKTKNFDMAISHQFKRLWWWGADVSTNNDIVGIATPIVLSFKVTWAQLASYTWASLNTWAQPLTVASSEVTTATTGTGTARRFAKFLKGLRYRQINFEVRLTTDGSTGDGPARLFTMLIITESKQVVPGSVS